MIVPIRELRRQHVFADICEQPSGDAEYLEYDGDGYKRIGTMWTEDPLDDTPYRRVAWGAVVLTQEGEVWIIDTHSSGKRSEPIYVSKESFMRWISTRLLNN